MAKSKNLRYFHIAKVRHSSVDFPEEYIDIWILPTNEDDLPMLEIYSQNSKAKCCWEFTKSEQERHLDDGKEFKFEISIHLTGFIRYISYSMEPEDRREGYRDKILKTKFAYDLYEG